MPSPADIVVDIGPLRAQRFECIDIESDLMTPADCWSATLPWPGELPAQLVEGLPVRVRIDKELVLSGCLDEVEESIGAHGELSLFLSGRDDAGVLADCSAPLLNARELSLAEVVAKIVRPLGITRIVASATAKKRIVVEPGESAWDALLKSASANGQWSWFAPDGVLHVGRPDAASVAVGRLILNRDGRDNNVLSLRRNRRLTPRYSQVTLLGQSAGSDVAAGQHDLRAVVRDRTLKQHRPLIEICGEADSLGELRAYARKRLADGRLEGFTLTAKVAGFRAPNGALWTPGQRVEVVSDLLGIKATTYYLMSRRFSRSRREGDWSELTLKEDGVWQFAAKPERRRHKAALEEA